MNRNDIAIAEEQSAPIWTLEEIGDLVSPSGNPAETLTNVVNLIRERFATDVCSVYLLEPDRANLVLAATIGLRPESVGRVRMRITEGLAGLVAEQVRPVVVHDTTTHPRFKYFRDAGEDPLSDVSRRAGHGPRRAAGRARRADGGSARPSATTTCACWRRPARSWRRSSARRARSGSSSRRCTSGWPRSRGICGGAGTTRASACFAISIRSLWRECDHNPIALLQQTPIDQLELRASQLALHGRINHAYRRLQEYLQSKHTWGARHASVLGARPVAYFSAEFGLHESMPIYSGGLGILAGDHLKSASDLGIPLVGIGLYYDQGYFRQRLDRDGWQHEEYIDVDHRLLPMQPATHDGVPVTVEIETRTGRIVARVWRIAVGRNTLLLLDSNVDGNSPEDRELTARLYGGDQRVRIRQELLLGDRRRARAGGARHLARRRAPERGAQRLRVARAGAAADGHRGDRRGRGDAARRRRRSSSRRTRRCRPATIASRRTSSRSTSDRCATRSGCRTTRSWRSGASIRTTTARSSA